ncbi:hypothetical protein PA598K_01484 [Paenibacillus sp. 598K]|nr:hypothetical protein PA598K_01484 [Paenibacillus sp. 598K]
MLMRVLRWIAPWLRKKEAELARASERTTLSINRYRTSSRELQEVIERNNFAKYLIYDKGD